MMRSLLCVLFCLLITVSVSGNALFDRIFHKMSGKGRLPKQRLESFLSAEKNKDWTGGGQLQHSSQAKSRDNSKLLETLGNVAFIAMHQVTKLAVYYFLMKWTLDYVSKVSEKMSKDFARQAIDQVPASLQCFLKQNVTLTTEEMELISNMKAPEDIKDDWRQLGGLMQLKKTAAQLYHVSPINANHTQNNNQSTTQHSNHDGRNVLTQYSSHSALFYGPPGCGKSTLIRGLCRQLKCPLLEITPSMIQRKYFGESTALIRAVLTLAGKLTHCVIFLDEIDSLFSTRKADDPAHDRAIKTEFMQLWDQLVQQQESSHRNHNWFIFGATNRPQDVDPAVLRRFERSFLLSFPGPDERRDIIRRMLRFIRKERGFDFDRLVQLTDGFSGSDILNLCKAAVSQLRHEERLRLSRLAAATGQSLSSSAATDISASMTSSVEKRNDELHRPLKTSDIEEVASTFQPTSWVAAAYGRMNNNNNQQQMDFAFNPDMLNGGDSNSFNSFTPQSQSQQQGPPPPSPYQWDMSEEEEEEDDDEV